ncbi:MULTISPECIES: zf-HC2 domain-containing protein [unclassified Duganella]|uniref:zf-HC2 domain-containing protein n=1 Tax=unclassified Duganella TaxID=2636909 RepID=UPI001E3B2F9D|nr:MULTISPECIES: zf-HC2 domain-containing protein [unclassified Duganella]
MDIPAHQAVQELLPWHASGQLAPEETQRVQEHLQSCAECRRDLEWERELRAEAAASEAVTSDAVPEGVDMERALARLMPALGPQEHTEHTAPASLPSPAVNAGRVSWWRAAAANQPSWLRWTVAAQWVAIIGLGALLLRPDSEPAPYHVLGSAVSSGGNLVVIFQPDTTERELRRILQAQGARVVDGPTVTDAYLLNVPAAGREHALLSLRADPAVKLAEALDGSGAP